MSPIKLLQTWDTVAGREQEYAAFIAWEFLPAIKASGLDATSGWYCLIGGGAHIRFESVADSLSQVEKAWHDPQVEEMFGRFMNLVANYGSCVWGSPAWMPGRRRDPPSGGGVKLVQEWTTLPGKKEAYEHLVQAELQSRMEEIGLELTGVWRLMIGSGPTLCAEMLAPDMAGLAKGLGDERYLRLMVQMQELATLKNSCVLTPHESFLDVIHDRVGRAIREVPPDEMHSMVGPIGE